MFDPKKINEVVENILESLPEGLKNAPDDIKKHVRAVVSDQLSKLDVVTREEFDIQMKVLKKTRAKLDELERQVASIAASEDAGQKK